MRKFILLIFLTGCATEVRQVRGPNGKKAFSISCKRDIGNCYEQAAQLCPYGYNQLGQSSKTSAVVPMNGMYVPVSKDNIFIECKSRSESQET